MNECGIVLDGLNKIGCERILKKGRHGARGFEIRSPDVFSITSLADNDVSKPPLQIVQIFCKAKDRHDFGCSNNVESIFSRKTVADAAKGDHGLPQRAVIHIDRTPPRDTAGIEAERIPPIDMVID